MIFLLLLLGLGVVGAWFVAQVTQTAVSDARAQTPGDMAALSDGLTHFRWHGPEDGRVMVCIHGLSTPSYVWEALVPLLTAQGFRVLTYDLYGRGLSDRAPGPQTREFFLRQLRDLLASQGIDGPVTLCGFSMGGAIATARAVEAPDSVSRLILVAPAGLGLEPGRFAAFCAEYPVIGDWLHAVAGPLLFHWHLSRLAAAAGSEISRGIATRTLTDLRIDGTMAAILSSQRNMLAEEMVEDHRIVARSGVPVLAVWGLEDRVIPLEAMGRLTKANRSAVQAQVAGAGHGLPHTHPDQLADAIEESL